MLEIMSRKLDSKDDYFQHLVFYYYYLNSIQIEFVSGIKALNVFFHY